MAIIYSCPATPIDMTIRKSLKDDWFIWKDEEPQTFKNRLFYKVFQSKYHFHYLTIFTHGSFSFAHKPNENHIACCGWQQQEKKSICAYKTVKESNCKKRIQRDALDGFICSNINSLT